MGTQDPLIVISLPVKWTIPHLSSTVLRAVKTPFKILMLKGVHVRKCFLQFPNRANVIKLLAVIKNSPLTNMLKASICRDSTKLEFVEKFTKKYTTADVVVPIKNTLENVLVVTFLEILLEMRMRYNKIFELSKKSGHLLLDTISQGICDKLKALVKGNSELCENPVILSKKYRDVHPHDTDFQYIVTTYNMLEAKNNVKPVDLTENDLILNNQIKEAVCNKTHKFVFRKFVGTMEAKMIKYIGKLDSHPAPDDTVIATAHKKVREELKKMTPFLKTLLKRSVQKNLIISKESHIVHVLVYGIPFLPEMDVMEPFLRKYHPEDVHRSERLFNLLRFSLPTSELSNLRAMDGTTIGGAKLVIRTPNIPAYVIPPSIISELKAMFGVEHDQHDTNFMDYDGVKDSTAFAGEL